MERPALYNRIGAHYNVTRRADPYLVSRFQHFLAPLATGNYLDIGCGTGNYTCGLAGERHQFYGVDPSNEMLAKARARDCKVIWREGIAESLPFDDGFFAGAMCSLTIHHWNDLVLAFGEISRVLNPGSNFVLFTAFREQMTHYWLNYYFPEMMRESATQMPAFTVVKAALESAGFEIVKREDYFIKDDLRDHFLYCGKNRPELYLREEIRRGISSFSSLKQSKEIETGLRRLAEDIRENRVSGIIEKYQSAEGDYAFIVAEARRKRKTD